MGSRQSDCVCTLERGWQKKDQMSSFSCFPHLTWLQCTGVPSRVYSSLTPSVPKINYESIAMNDDKDEWVNELINEYINVLIPQCHTKSCFGYMAGPTLFTLKLTGVLTEGEGILSLSTWPRLEKHDKKGVSTRWRCQWQVRVLWPHFSFCTHNSGLEET